VTTPLVNTSATVGRSVSRETGYSEDNPVYELARVLLSSGGASYGAKGLKLPQFLLQPLQNFCAK